MHRTAVTTTLFALMGVGVGLVLPRSTTASVVLLAGAAACLALVALHAESLAPLHGLHRVVRLPFLRSIALTCVSFTSRAVGSVRALVRVGPQPTPLVLDEPDDEAEAWWGATSAPAPVMPGMPSPEPAPEPWPPSPPTPVPAPALPAPVLAAPLPSAHVSVSVMSRAHDRVERLRSGTSRHLKALGTRAKTMTTSKKEHEVEQA
ncbi:MAG TPA: hypothetical protein VGN51_03105 [Acidimicrobiia bacterium]